MRQVEFEDTQYRLNDVAHAAYQLVDNYVRYSDIAGAVYWLAKWPEIRTNIKQQRPTPTHLQASGVELVFSGLPSPTLQMADEEDKQKLVYKSREPYFRIMVDNASMLPTERLRAYKMNEAIVEEMEEVYHLKYDTETSVLVFPKKEYASVSILEVPLLS